MMPCGAIARVKERATRELMMDLYNRMNKLQQEMDELKQPKVNPFKELEDKQIIVT